MMGAGIAGAGRAEARMSGAKMVWVIVARRAQMVEIVKSFIISHELECA